MSAPRESDDQWRRKTLTASCSYPSACVLQNDIMPIGFPWLFHPFHLSSCFTFGHGGCSLQRDVSWNLHRSINFCFPPCSIPKLTRRSTFCLPFASERFLAIRAEIPFGRVFFFPMVKLPPKRAQQCAKKVQNERKSAQKSANERKFKKCYESQVANCICADVSSTFC